MTRIAFLAGCQETSDEDSPRYLHGLKSDLQLMNDVVFDPLIGDFSRPRSTTLHVTARPDDFMRSFRDVVNRAEAGDELLVYYTGHGKATPDGRGLLLCEGSESGLPFDALLAFIRSSSVTRYGIVLDCCRSGLVTSAKSADGFKSAIEEISAELLHPGSFVVTSSRDFELSRTLESGPSVFTKLIYDGLQAGRISTGGALEIVEYVQYRLDTDPDFSPFLQRPQFTANGGGKPFTFRAKRSSVNAFEATPIPLDNVFEMPLGALDWGLVAAYTGVDLNAPEARTVTLLRERNLILGSLPGSAPEIVRVRSEVLLTFATRPDEWIPSQVTEVILGDRTAGTMRYVHGPLYTQYLDAFKITMEHAGRLIGAPALPDEFARAVREALSNAIVHREIDQGVIRVWFEGDFVCISNPVDSAELPAWLNTVSGLPQDAELSRYRTSSRAERLSNVLKMQGVKEGRRLGTLCFQTYRTFLADELAVAVKFRQKTREVCVSVKLPPKSVTPDLKAGGAPSLKISIVEDASRIFYDLGPRSQVLSVGRLVIGKGDLKPTPDRLVSPASFASPRVSKTPYYTALDESPYTGLDESPVRAIAGTEPLVGGGLGSQRLFMTPPTETEAARAKATPLPRGYASDFTLGRTESSYIPPYAPQPAPVKRGPFHKLVTPVRSLLWARSLCSTILCLPLIAVGFYGSLSIPFFKLAGCAVFGVLICLSVGARRAWWTAPGLVLGVLVLIFYFRQNFPIDRFWWLISWALLPLALAAVLGFSEADDDQDFTLILAVGLAMSGAFMLAGVGPGLAVRASLIVLYLLGLLLGRSPEVLSPKPVSQ